ncbi:hypothetical protein FGG08_003095 [Glutinoglossum americanum]|uniref:Uncharacterized protein n=1 Tax=Glutinoglossum americanum TaxID=1670608 RepID=A0A9P8I3A5_9PEZI|nr:hypothetical protein FGG08_003095 [Glutinoglossum americanum]
MATSESTGSTDQTVSEQVIKKFHQEAAVFASRNDQVFIEVGSFDDPNSSYYNEVEVAPDKLQDWLSPKSSYCVRSKGETPPRVLRLLVCPLNVDMSSFLPIPKEKLQQSLRLLNLEDSYVCDEQLQAPPNWFNIPLDDGLEGFIIKPEMWDSEVTNFSLLMVTNPSSGTTCGVLHMLLKAELQQVRKRLDALRKIAWNPMLLPTILVELRTKSIPNNLSKIRTAVYETEKVIGTHKNYEHKSTHARWGYYAQGREVWDREGFESSAGELTSLASHCVLLESKCQINLRLLQWIEEMDNALPLGAAGQRAGPGAQPKAALSGKIAFMRNGLENNRIRSEYLGKRAQVQVQACLSIMSQRDNALNLRISAAAVDTSEAAARDSTDMRTIAAVTLAFLPATFAAVGGRVPYPLTAAAIANDPKTFFSTGFFNFQKENRVVSAWIWLYWVVTLGLTAVVFGGWVGWARLSRVKPGKSGGSLRGRTRM